MARDPRLAQQTTTVRFTGAAENQVQRRKGELGRYIVRFLAVHSPPDQLKSVVEDCELLAEDETLMNLAFIEEVCEAVHDESLALLPFLPPGDTQKPRQVLIQPPQPLPVSEFPEALEAYRLIKDCRNVQKTCAFREGARALLNILNKKLFRSLRIFLESRCIAIWGTEQLPSKGANCLNCIELQLEEAFENYVRELCNRAACVADVYQASAKARYSTSVYSRFVSPRVAGAISSTQSTTTVADPAHTPPVDGAAVKDAEALHRAPGAGQAPTAAAPGESGAGAKAAAGEELTGQTAANADSTERAEGDAATASGPAAASSVSTATAVPSKSSLASQNAAASAGGSPSAPARSASGGYCAPPPCPRRVLCFLKGGEKEGDFQDPGPFAKLTAVVSARRGDVRIHSHSCEDWNAQVSYRRCFRRGNLPSSPFSAATATTTSTSTAAATSAAVNVGKDEGLSNGEEGPPVGAPGEADGEGVYDPCCEQVADPRALAEKVIRFIERKNLEVVKEQRHLRSSYARLMLKRLRRVLPLTGERFDWQQQQIHLQPRQQL